MNPFEYKLKVLLKLSDKIIKINLHLISYFLIIFHTFDIKFVIFGQILILV